MRPASVFKLILAIVPVVYCGGLLFYFLDISGSVQGATEIGLGPTMLGLAVVGLIFCIPLIVKIVRISAGPRASGSGGHGGPDAPIHDSDSGVDAEAAVARYLARRSAEATAASPVPSTHDLSGAAKSSGFSRRIG